MTTPLDTKLYLRDLRMSLARLRDECPTWVWSAERSGMGWRYVGRRGGERVTIRGVAVGFGPFDDVRTRWVVEGTGESYTSWMIRVGHFSG